MKWGQKQEQGLYFQYLCQVAHEHGLSIKLHVPMSFAADLRSLHSCIRHLVCIGGGVQVTCVVTQRFARFTSSTPS